MSPRKLIVALDFSNQQDACALIEQLDPNLCALKIGSQMFTLFGTEFLRALSQKGFNVFLDLKFHDIPNTVAAACQAAAELGVWMITIHALGGVAMMQAALHALNAYGEKRPLLMGVTVLTSMTQADLAEIGIQAPLEIQVAHLAMLALQAGLDGVVCSAFEVPMIKKTCGNQFLTVTPGIRLAGNALDDQRRVMTAAQAKAMGSDFLVVGRSITAAAKPSKVVEELLLAMS